MSGMDLMVVVVEDERNQREIILEALRDEGMDAIGCPDLQSARKTILDNQIGCVISDFKLPDGTGEDLLDWIKEQGVLCPFVIITAFGDVKKAVSLLRKGARDYLSKPVNLDELIHFAQSSLQQQAMAVENSQLKRLIASQGSEGALVTRSPVMFDVIRRARAAGTKDVSVLITGETGSGKEMLARFIHDTSMRSDGPFIPVNCAAVPRELLESELFGHVKGSFTGAVRDRRGSFESAAGGTLFLDEVGEIPLDLQAKFLRALQERKITPVGCEESRKVDFRLVCATNRDLRAMIGEGNFREDLYFRLGVIHVSIPPLRDRPEDIEALSEHFISRYGAIHGSHCRRISSEAMNRLKAHGWPGNVRELENVIEASLVFAMDDTLQREDLEMAGSEVSRANQSPAGIEIPDEPFNLKEMLDTVEKTVILEVLKRCGGVKLQAAKYLGMDEKSMRYKITKYGI
ncbi:MAG: hypothetical protein CVV64_16900 [Candidatus Wallbacteria bacterium HGW-Wallbacteria-1]|jgi:two-component system NtrC family response regulator|uniref:Sigma-54-dependent Fis family transcriptional regulator n=1 Tax=Candidatus Wallbacteria bacterium HGW-Wallbacteria-1 TaxID=2013854 RepID=A0A2N1PKH9_9BACT|nr:MAG: hypothetical protein CVV64_16900 [Candidatus Wallbacteria bacterium HGW-Wallbacteria-1]